MRKSILAYILFLGVLYGLGCPVSVADECDAPSHAWGSKFEGPSAEIGLSTYEKTGGSGSGGSGIIGGVRGTTCGEGRR